jgi:TPR repeat protein
MNKHISSLIFGVILSFCIAQAEAQNAVTREMLNLKSRAEQGHVQSALTYAKRCMNIYWKFETDNQYVCSEKEGFNLLKIFANKGNAEAQLIVGENLYWGERGAVKNYIDSFNYLHKSAVQNNAKAQEWIGDFYSWGVISKRDPIKAYAWYLISKSNGGGSKDPVDELSKEQIIQGQEFAKICNETNFKICPQ